MKNYQQIVKDFAKEQGFDAPPMARLADLASEVAELGKELLLGTDYGKSELRLTANTENELGDVIFVLMMLANSLELDLEKCLNKSMEKYRKRLS